MKIKEVIKVDREVLKEWKCNRCGNSMETEPGNAYECDISLRSGYYDRDGGGEGYNMEWDICETCSGHLVQLLNAFCKIPATESKWEC